MSLQDNNYWRSIRFFYKIADTTAAHPHNLMTNPKNRIKFKAHDIGIKKNYIILR